MGAWIETKDSRAALNSSTSHPMWVRGLKQPSILTYQAQFLSHPMWVRGLKQQKYKQDATYHRRTLCGCVD